MKPLIVLLLVFGLSWLVLRLWLPHADGMLAARIAMAAMLLFTALGHFMFTKGMTLMLPAFLPFREGIVYGTGILEIAAAAGLLLPVVKRETGIALIIFFVLLLPANIYAAAHQLDYEKGTYTGKGLAYLWFRVPLQLFFIAWVYVCAVR